MNVNTYSIKKDKNYHVTKNITVWELKSRDGADIVKQDYVVVCIAQYSREVYDRAFIINSAYRTISWNKKVGGTANSKHLISCAIDGWIRGVAQQDLANLFYSIGLNRVGVYEDFVHFDTARSPEWLSQGNFKKVNVPYLNRLISAKVNRNDYQVAIIQYKLNLLGYNCGIEDGIAGVKFTNAVKKFQQDKGLGIDGIVGKNTWNRLFN
jgi:hypothetical protein